MKETTLNITVRDDGVWSDDVANKSLKDKWQSFFEEVLAVGDGESVFYLVVVNSADEKDLGEEVEEGEIIDEIDEIDEDETLGG